MSIENETDYEIGQDNIKTKPAPLALIFTIRYS